MSFGYHFRMFIWRMRTPPLVYFSEFMWIVFSGWNLFLLYFLGGISFISTIIFIPFAWQLFKVAVFSFDPIRYDLEPYPFGSGFMKDPNSFYVIIGNIVWFIIFGWAIALWHLFLALIAALTIFGISNALKHVEIAAKTAFPLGKQIVRRPYPPRPSCGGDQVVRV